MSGIELDKKRIAGCTEVRSPCGWTPITRIVIERYHWGRNLSVDGGYRLRVIGDGISTLVMNAITR